MKKALLSVSIVVLLSPLSIGQTTSDTTDRVNKKRLWWTGGIQLGLYTGGMIGLSQLWYQDYNGGSFHFFNDNMQWQGVDKLGHMQTAHWLTESSTSLWRYAGMTKSTSRWLGAGYATLVLGTVEVFDGLSEGWGFSTGDFASNLLGSGLYLGQDMLWGEQRIRPKFSVHRSQYAQYNPSLLGSSLVERIVKDYNGQTYWLSFQIAGLTPWKKLPPWLCLSLGYSAYGMTGGSTNPAFNRAGMPIPNFSRERRFLLSLDIDVTKIQTEKVWLKSLFKTFGFVKIPLPTVGIGNGKVIWYGAYF